MIVHPDHPVVLGYSQAGNPTPPAEMDWTRAFSGRKCRGHSASSAWVINFNNGNCNHNDLHNNNYVRAVR